MTEAGVDGFGIGGFLALVPALLACGVLPGAWVAGRLGAGDGFARVGAGVLLSALATFGLGWVALTAGVGVGPAAVAVGACAVVAGVALVAAARHAPSPAVARPPRAWSAAALAAWTLLVVAVYAANPELRYRVDGWFHGAVTARLLAVGLPPDDPYFAGQPLHYPWAWHVVLAVTARVAAPFGATVFDAMAGWSALAALSVGACLAALGRAWATAAGLPAAVADRAGAAAIALAVLGPNPLGAAFWLGRGLAGHEAGLGELARPLAGGASETLLAATWHYPHASLAAPVDKFLTPTAFGLGEAALLAFAGCALGVFAPPTDRARPLAGATLVALAALFLHPAAALGLAGLGVVAVAALVASPAAGARAHAARIAAPLAVAFVVAAPYLAATRAGDGGARLAVRGDMLWAVAVVGGLVLALAWRERGRLAAAEAPRRAFVLGASGLLALACVVTLVQRNETKLVNLALVALAVPAGVGVARLPGRAALALVACLVPTHALAVAGFVHDRGQDTPGRRVPGPALAAAYAWIGAHTAPRDVFLEAQPADARDPDRDLLVHGPRALVWGGAGYATNWGYPAADLARREQDARALADGVLDEAAVADLRERAAARGGRAYAVRREAAVPPTPAGAGTWTRVFANEALALDRLEPAGAPGGGR